MMQKVFCIGFHKTGTSSMEAALRILGYRVTGPNAVKNPNIRERVFDMADELVAAFDAFQDNPWPIIFKEMDAKYPGNKFILTVREPSSWIRSQVKHFGTKVTPMRQWIYGDDCGCPEGNEDVYLKRYEGHNAEVLAYFRDRPDDLLVVDLANGDGWDKLCPFLGIEPPSDTPFPHANAAGSRQKNNRFHMKVIRKLKRMIGA